MVCVAQGPRFSLNSFLARTGRKVRCDYNVAAAVATAQTAKHNSCKNDNNMNRAVRARYPNVGKVEFVMGAMQVHASSRFSQFKFASFCNCVSLLVFFITFYLSLCCVGLPIIIK
jgi:hypothetical protein